MTEKYMKTIQFQEGGDVYHPLPLLSNEIADNGKILQVVDGEWAAVSVANAEEVAY